MLSKFRSILIAPLTLLCLTTPGCSDDAPLKMDRGTASPSDGSGSGKDKGAAKNCSGKFKVEDLKGNAATETEDKTYIFDQKKLHEFKLEIAPADWTFLQNNALKEQYVPASVVFDGKRYKGAAVRYKGDWSSLKMCFDSSGKLTCKKLSLKVRFNKYDTCGRFHGMRRINFNSSRIDLSMMRERVAWSLMKDLGMRASLASHAKVSVNGVSQGLFVMVEQIDKEYLEDHFTEADGNLYKQVWPLHDYASIYDKALKTNEDQKPSPTRLIQFTAALKKATPTSAAKDLAGFMDLKRMARALAVHLAIGNWDGPITFRCWTGWCVNNNYYLYDEPKGLISMLPWDLDNIFYDEPKTYATTWWTKKPASCAPVEPCKHFGTTPCPPSTPTKDGLVQPAPCDPLLSLPVAAYPEEYDAMLKKLPAALARSITSLATWQAQVKAAVAADKNGPGAAKFASEGIGLKGHLNKKIKAINAYLAQKK